MSDQQALYTCVTCNVAFREAEKQRLHYKSDWHRYNLKRKIADLAPVSAQIFAERVQLQKSELEKQKAGVSDERFCTICGKHFTTLNSYTNHLQSKKHRDLEAKVVLTDAQKEVIQTGIVPKPKTEASPVKPGLTSQREETSKMETDNQDGGDDQESNWEDVEDEIENFGS
jgi:hypothetical protein